MIEVYEVQAVLSDILGVSILYGMLMGGTIFLIVLVTRKLLSLYNLITR